MDDTRGGNVKREDPRLNPLAPDDSTSVCAICSLTMHWTKQCPHAHERQQSDVFVTAATRGDNCNEEKCIEVMLCTAGGARRNKHLLLDETAGMASLDSGCHRTVCSKRWLLNFTSCFSDKERCYICIEHSSAIYRFVDGKHKKALRCATFPCRFGWKRVNIRTDVIDSAIPLFFMSCCSMKTARMIINVAEDTAVVFGNAVNLTTTSTGNYILPLFSNDPH